MKADWIRRRSRINYPRTVLERLHINYRGNFLQSLHNKKALIVNTLLCAFYLCLSIKTQAKAEGEIDHFTQLFPETHFSSRWSSSRSHPISPVSALKLPRISGWLRWEHFRCVEKNSWAIYDISPQIPAVRCAVEPRRRDSGEAFGIVRFFALGRQVVEHLR